MPESPRRLLVLSPNWLGDAVMALPAIDGVRTRYPHAHLAVAARPAIAPLFSMVPGVDEGIEIEWRGGIRQIGAMRRDSARMHALGARVAILLPNSFASAWLARAGRIPERWGYARDLRRALLTRAIQPPQGSRHQGAY